MLGRVKRFEGTAQRRRSAWSTAVVAVLALVGGVQCAFAQGALNIVIERGRFKPVPVAVVPFGWQGTGAVPYDVSGVVASDLRNSGRFAPIATTDMVSRPTQSQDINFQDWRVLDVDALVIGQLAPDGPDRYSAVFELFDVRSGQQLLGFRLTAGTDDLRAAGHRIADMIFEKLTGIPGVFSTQVAYVSEERRTDGSKRFRLIVSDADGEHQNVVADSPQPLMSPSWSPDGRRIAYVSFEGDHSNVFVQTLSTGNRQNVSSRAGVNGSPAFSPDGRLLALTLSHDQGNLDIYTLDLATQMLRQVTTDAAIDTESSWSPDGRMLYFNSDRSGGPQVYRTGIAPGSRPERITYEGTYNARPRVSPDGKQLAVVYGQNNQFRIGVIDVASGTLNVLTNGKLDESPSYAPNGAEIIYATRDGNRGVLAAVSTDGRVHREIASVAGDVREPVWGPYPRP